MLESPEQTCINPMQVDLANGCILISNHCVHPTSHHIITETDLLHSGGEANARVGGIEDGVVVLQELLTNNGVDARSSTVGDPGVEAASGETKVGVLSSGDQVLVGREGVSDGAKLDTKVGSGLGGVDDKTRRGVSTATRSSQEGVIGRGGDVDQGGAGVDNTRGAGSEGSGAVSEARNGDTPVWRSSAACKLGVVGERAGVLGSIDATKGQLAVGVGDTASRDGLEGNTEDFG